MSETKQEITNETKAKENQQFKLACMLYMLSAFMFAAVFGSIVGAQIRELKSCDQTISRNNAVLGFAMMMVSSFVWPVVCLFCFIGIILLLFIDFLP